MEIEIRRKMEALAAAVLLAGPAAAAAQPLLFNLPQGAHLTYSVGAAGTYEVRAEGPSSHAGGACRSMWFSYDPNSSVSGDEIEGRGCYRQEDGRPLYIELTIPGGVPYNSLRVEYSWSGEELTSMILMVNRTENSSQIAVDVSSGVAVYKSFSGGSVVDQENMTFEPGSLPVGMSIPPLPGDLPWVPPGLHLEEIDPGESGDVSLENPGLPGRLMPIHVEAGSVEEVTVPAGEFTCFRVSLSPQGVSAEELGTLMWVTEQSPRIPVALELRIWNQSTRLELLSWEGPGRPSTSRPPSWAVPAAALAAAAVAAAAYLLRRSRGTAEGLETLPPAEPGSEGEPRTAPGESPPDGSEAPGSEGG